MPRYRFRWQLVPRWLTNRLARELDLGGDAIAALQRVYGMRPKDVFIRENWPLLRDVWLARDTELRRWVVDELRASQLGDLDLPIRNRQQQLAYLASCRNAETLRSIVLDAFHVLGDIGVATTDGPRVPAQNPREDSSPPAQESIRTDDPGLDLDAAVRKSWLAFAFRLTGSLEDLLDDQVIIIELPTPFTDDELDGATPYVQFTGYDEGSVRAETSGNAYLDPQLALDEKRRQQMVALGWKAPTFGPSDEPDGGSPNYFVDAVTTDGAALSQLTVRTLQEVFGVPHPSFLTASGFAIHGDRDAPPVDLGVPLPGGDSRAEASQPLAVMPDGPEQLRDLVDIALIPVLGNNPIHDEDDDIAVRSGSAMVFIRVLPDAPIVELFSPVLVDVEGSPLVLERITKLNRRVRFASFTWEQGTVFAMLQLFCLPFVGEHLRHALQVMSEIADGLDDELRLELGGRSFFGEPGGKDTEAGIEEATLPAELLTIMQLDLDGTRAITPELAAKICHHDRDMVLRFIRIAETDAIEWRKAAENARQKGDPDDEANAADHEAVAWDATAQLLRDALLVIAQR